MEKALQSIAHGAFAVLMVPLAMVMLLSMIILLMRRPPGQPVRVRSQDRRR